MVIVKISGGLGNQMFQIAFAICHAKKHKIVKLDTSYFDQDRSISRGQDQGLEIYKLFNVPFLVATKRDFFHFANRIKKGNDYFIQLKPNRRFFLEEQSFDFNYYKGIYDIDDTYFKGYWQNIMYLKKSQTELLKFFKFRRIDKLDHKNYVAMKKMKKTNSVSIHIRRGDYLFASHLYPLKLKYYQMAIEIIKESLQNPIFFIFSDDIEWAKLNLKIDCPDYIDFNTGTESFKDMQLMSNCAHNIIANSTFSWWGAFLNQNPKKLVVAPKDWSIEKIEEKFLPKKWILI